MASGSSTGPNTLSSPLNNVLAGILINVSSVNNKTKHAILKTILKKFSSVKYIQKKNNFDNA